MRDCRAVGMTIREARRELGWTQERMAREMDVGESSLRRWEATEAPPAMVKLARLLVGIDRLRKWCHEG